MMGRSVVTLKLGLMESCGSLKEFSMGSTNVDWNVIRNARGGQTALAKFASGTLSLNRMRRQFRNNRAALAAVYRLERIGVDRARPRARQALSR